MRDSTIRRAGRLAGIGAAVLLLCGVAAGPAAAQLDSFFDKMKGVFGAPEPPAPQQRPQADDADLPCPAVDIRNGASTLTVYGAKDEIATNVRYQATFAQTARECVRAGANMTVRLGVRGRVILGPLGGAGQINVPIRIALVKEGPEPRTLLSKLHVATVPIPEGQTNVPFSYVEQDLVFPVASSDDMENYIFYVGFDEQGMRAAPRPKKRGRMSPSG